MLLNQKKIVILFGVILSNLDIDRTKKHPEASGNSTLADLIRYMKKLHFYSISCKCEHALE